MDEVGELPLTTQVRLLRVLEAGEFIKVGSSKVQKTDVRVVAATNMDMPRAIAEGRFREDLFYRLNSVPIVIPPLRDRGNDIVLLFRKFAVDFADKYRMPAVKLTPEATQLLLTYPWPGNVRQLKNITEQISVLEQNREISKETLLRYLPSANNMERLPVFVGSQSGHSGDKSFNSEREILYQVLFDMKKDMDDLKKLVHDIMSKGNVDMSTVATPDTIHNIYPNDDIQTIVQQPQHPQPQQQSPLKMSSQKDIQDTEEYVEESFSLEDVERDMIKKALERHNNRRKYAAQDLKISERTLYRKIKEYGLE